MAKEVYILRSLDTGRICEVALGLGDLAGIFVTGRDCVEVWQVHKEGSTHVATLESLRMGVITNDTSVEANMQRTLFGQEGGEE